MAADNLLGPLSNIDSGMDSVDSSINEGIDVSRSNGDKLDELIEAFGKNGYFKETLDSLAAAIAPVSGDQILSNNEKEKDNQDSSDGDLFQGLDSDFFSQAEDISGGSAIQAKTKKNIKESAAVEFQSANKGDFGTGLALIWWKLDEIAKNTSSDKKKKGGGISGFFKGLLEGVSGIAALGVALLAFAGATLIFNFVNWGKAIVGLLAFTAFTVGMVGLAKLLKPEKENLVSFAEGSMLMSAALSTFAVSLYIASSIFSGGSINVPGIIDLPGINLGGAIAALVTFGAFMAGVTGLAKLAGESTKEFAQFGMGSFMLASSLAVFALSLSIASKIFEGTGLKIPILNIELDAIKVASALTAIGMFTAFAIGMGIVARIVGNNGAQFTKFAVGTMAMAGALAVFSLSLLIVDRVFDEGAEFTVPVIGAKVRGVNTARVWEALGMFGAFIGGFVLIATLANSFAGNIALFAGTTMLMSLSLASFGLALGLAVWAVEGGDMDAGPLGHFSMKEGNKGLAALESLGLMTGFLTAYAALGLALTVVGPFVALAAGVCLGVAGTTILMAKALTFATMMTTGGKITWDGTTYEFYKYDPELGKQGFDAFSDIAKQLTSIDLPGIFKTIAQAKKLTSLSEAIVVIANSISQVQKMNLDAKRQEDQMGGWDKAFEPFINIVNSLVSVANNMDKQGRKSFALVSQALLPIADSITKISGLITSFKKIDDKTINMAITQMKKIMGGVKGKNSGFLAVFNLVTKSVKGVRKSAVETIKVMPEVSQSILSVTKTIKEASQINNIEQSIERLLKVTDFVKKLTDVLRSFTPGGLREFFLGDPFEQITNANKLMSDQVVPSISSLKYVADNIADMKDMQVSINNTMKMVNFVKSLQTVLSNITPEGIKGAFKTLWEGSPEDTLDRAKDLMVNKIRPCIESLGIINEVMLKLSSSRTASADNIKKQLTNLTTAFEAITDMSNSDVSKVERISKSVAGFTTTFSSINISMDFLNQIAPASIDDSGNAIVRLAVATERLSSALASGALSLKDFNKEYKNLDKKIQSEVVKNASAIDFKVNPTVSGGPKSQLEKDVESIKDILMIWNEQGIMVYSNSPNTPAPTDKPTMPVSIFKI